MNSELQGDTAKDYMQMLRVMTKVREYVYGATAQNLKARNEALTLDSQLGFNYNQGALDVCMDVIELLNGGNLAVLNKIPRTEDCSVR